MAGKTLYHCTSKIKEQIMSMQVDVNDMDDRKPERTSDIEPEAKEEQCGKCPYCDDPDCGEECQDDDDWDEDDFWDDWDDEDDDDWEEEDEDWNEDDGGRMMAASSNINVALGKG